MTPIIPPSEQRIDHEPFQELAARLNELHRSSRWQDWRWQIAKSIELGTLLKTISLTENGQLTPQHREIYSRMLSEFPPQTTPDFLSRAHDFSYADPVFRQIAPSVDELITSPEDTTDPIGDRKHSVISEKHPILIQRYPDRALLMISTRCPVHCRYCFRRNMLPAVNNEFPESASTSVMDYLWEHSELQELILTGGDPLMLSDRRIQTVLKRVNSIDHLKTIRIHTRMLIVNPFRITKSLLRIFTESSKPIWLVTHCNHSNELTNHIFTAVRSLLKAGVMVLNQSVLLRGVNHMASEMINLCSNLITFRIKPYYLHQCDQARGNSQFRVSLAEGLSLKRSLQGRLPGYALPTYCVDIPGGKGKIPLEPIYYSSLPDGFLLRTADGADQLYREGSISSNNGAPLGPEVFLPTDSES